MYMHKITPSSSNQPKDKKKIKLKFTVNEVLLWSGERSAKGLFSFTIWDNKCVCMCLLIGNGSSTTSLEVHENSTNWSTSSLSLTPGPKVIVYHCNISITMNPPLPFPFPPPRWTSCIFKSTKHLIKVYKNIWSNLFCLGFYRIVKETHFV